MGMDEKDLIIAFLIVINAIMLIGAYMFYEGYTTTLKKIETFVTMRSVKIEGKSYKCIEPKFSTCQSVCVRLFDVSEKCAERCLDYCSLVYCMKV